MENAMTEDLISRAVAIRDFDACNAYGPEWTPQRVKQLLVRQPPVYAMPEGIDSFDKAAELEKHLREFASTKECEAQCGLIRVLKEAADMLANQAYIILGVMHSVDKWLDGKELDQDEVNRAVTMREKVLRIIESRPEPIHAHIVVNWLGDCRCSYCETLVDCTEPFCQHCGARLDEPEEQEDEPNGRPDYA